RRLLGYAIASRILVLSLIVFWRSLISPYDTSASINPPCLSASSEYRKPRVLLPRLGASLESSIVWDGVYFVRIAECGYEYEQTYAFLPLLPFFISVLSKTVFAPLIPVIGIRAVLAFSGYVLNNIAFVFAALYLYRLSLVVLVDPELALRSSVLFCFNPASIFYSSLYSESLFALLSFGGLYYIMRGSDYRASFWFALSTFVRSNGILNAGYICFRKLLQVTEDFLYRKGTFLASLRNLLIGALCSLFVVIPFISFQAYGYSNICKGRHLTEITPPWCKARLPLLYSYIQSHYWGVGFLKYFQVKQVPNFLLGSPILSLSICSIVYYSKLYLSLGLKGEQHIQPLKDSETAQVQQNFADILPFIVHSAFMSATALLVMHVQVATRFLSASPLLYWFGSSQLMGCTCIGGRRWGYVIWAYCAAYILIGGLLFSNFYPFT
ncbi:hypothetical protein M569_11110, partial [Genlisea aurea]